MHRIAAEASCRHPASIVLLCDRLLISDPDPVGKPASRNICSACGVCRAGSLLPVPYANKKGWVSHGVCQAGTTWHGTHLRARRSTVQYSSHLVFPSSWLRWILGCSMMQRPMYVKHSALATQQPAPSLSKKPQLQHAPTISHLKFLVPPRTPAS